MITKKSEWLLKVEAWYIKAKSHTLWTNYVDPGDFKKIAVGISTQDRMGLYRVLGRIWVYLPDNSFNIMVNPPLWDDFIWLLDNYYE